MNREQPATVAIWREPRFRRFWAGQSISQLGDQVTSLALPLIAVAILHASASEVAVLTALIWTPNLLATFLGAWVDQRSSKRRLMVVADLARGAVLLSLPIGYLCGALSLGQLYAVAFITGCGGVLFNTAYPVFFAHLVPRASYVDANALLSSTQSGAYVAGPAVAGGLVQLLSAPVAVVADAASYLASAVLVGRIRLREPAPAPAAAGASTLRRRAGEGLMFIAGHPILRASLACSTMVNFFTFLSAGGLTVLFASRELGLSAGTIGLAFGVGATGALVGAVLAPALSRRIGVGRSIAIGAVLFPAPIAIMAAATGPVWARAAILGGAEFVSGVGVMLYDVNQNSLKASVIPDRLRARVSGAYSTVNYGVRPVGALLGGLLANQLGLRATLLIAAAGGTLSVVWVLLSPIPRVRRIGADDPAGTVDDRVHAAPVRDVGASV